MTTLGDDRPHGLPFCIAEIHMHERQSDNIFRGQLNKSISEIQSDEPQQAMASGSIEMVTPLGNNHFSLETIRS